MPTARSLRLCAMLLAAPIALPLLGQERKDATAPPGDSAATDSAKRLAEQAAAARRIIAEAPPPPVANPLAQFVIVRPQMDIRQPDGDVISLLLVEMPEQNAAGQFQMQRLKVAPATFDLWLFGGPMPAVTLRTDMDRLLRSKIDALDRTCRLTSDQKRKLELAGEGDVRSLLERVDDLRGEFTDGVDDHTKVVSLFRKNADLRTPVRSGPFGDGSLFAKMLARTLTAEQRTEYERAEAKTGSNDPAKPASGPPARSKTIYVLQKREPEP